MFVEEGCGAEWYSPPSASQVPDQRTEVEGGSTLFERLTVDVQSPIQLTSHPEPKAEAGLVNGHIRSPLPATADVRQNLFSRDPHDPAQLPDILVAPSRLLSNSRPSGETAGFAPHF